MKEIAYKMNTNAENMVVMDNNLFLSKSSLSLNSAKLIRLAVMQCKPSDTEFGLYKINIHDFADLLQIPSPNLYRDAKNICIQLLKEIVFIGDGNPHHKWKAFQWVSCCEYNEGVITIKLHDNLKPYLLGLKKNYSQYELESILTFKSYHTLRVFECIKEKMRGEVYGNKAVEFVISVEDLRKATNTEKKYKSFNLFKERVIDTAVREINERAFGFDVSYTYQKESRRVVGFRFKVTSKHNKASLDAIQRTEAMIERIEKNSILGQANIFDYI